MDTSIPQNVSQITSFDIPTRNDTFVSSSAHLVRNVAFDALPLLIDQTSPGIYAIVNRVNQHFYVGSAVNLLKRKQHHLRDLATSKHKNAHLQRAYDQHGVDAFSFVVLEYVEHVDNLLAREQYFIDTLNPQYNISRTARSNLGMQFTSEHKAKIRASRLANENMLAQMAKLNADRTGKHLSPEHRAKITANQLGKKQSPELVAKRAAALRGKPKPDGFGEKVRAAKLGHEVSLETRAKISAAKLGKKQSPELIAKRTAGQLGRKHSPESIEKMRIAKIGKKNTPEARVKMSASRTGKKASLETREKLRLNKNHLGKKHSPEAKEKMRSAKLGRKQSPEVIAKRIATQRANREKRKAEQQPNQLPLS